MVVALRKHRYSLLALEVHHLQGVALADVSQLLSVRRNVRHEVVLAVGDNLVYVDESGGVEVLLGGVLEGSLHYVPVAVNLSGVVDGLSVRIPGDHPLLVRSVGDSLGAAVVDPDNEEFAAVDQGNFLACRAYGHLGGVLYVYVLDFLVTSIVRDVDIQFLCLLTILNGVYVALPDKGDGAVLCDAYLPYREVLEICQLGLCPRCKILLEEIQGVVGLVELHLGNIVNSLSVRAEDRLQVLALVGADLGVSVCLEVIYPDVAGNGRCMVLSPRVLISLLVLEDDLASVGVEVGLVCTGCGYQDRPSAANRNLVKVLEHR